MQRTLISNSHIFRKIYTDNSHIIINLKHVSRVVLSTESSFEILFHMSHERKEINGCFMWFSGGDNVIHKITYNNKESAYKEYKEFNEILEIMKE